MIAREKVFRLFLMDPAVMVHEPSSRYKVYEGSLIVKMTNREELGEKWVELARWVGREVIIRCDGGHLFPFSVKNSNHTLADLASYMLSLVDDYAMESQVLTVIGPITEVSINGARLAKAIGNPL